MYLQFYVGVHVCLAAENSDCPSAFLPPNNFLSLSLRLCPCLSLPVSLCLCLCPSPPLSLCLFPSGILSCEDDSAGQLCHSMVRAQECQHSREKKREMDETGMGEQRQRRTNHALMNVLMNKQFILSWQYVFRNHEFWSLSFSAVLVPEKQQRGTTILFTDCSYQWKNDNTLFSRLPILRKQNYIPIGLSKLYKSFFMTVFGLINFIIL